MQAANSTFIVTGGASGLGAGAARRLVAAGASVMIADLNASAGEALANELGPKATFVATDVTSEDSAKAAIGTAVKQFGALNGLVNCAGILGASRIVGRDGPHDLALFQRVIQVNLVGTFNMLRLAAASMSSNPPDAEGERGVIINTASVAAFEGQIGQAAYAASKGGVASLTLPAARELARFGIRVVTIAPGIFDTPLLGTLPEPVRQSLAKQVPFPQRLGRPSEFAALACHIIENAMLNGETIRLDGAIRMAPR